MYAPTVARSKHNLCVGMDQWLTECDSLPSASWGRTLGHLVLMKHAKVTTYGLKFILLPHRSASWLQVGCSMHGNACMQQQQQQQGDSAHQQAVNNHHCCVHDSRRLLLADGGRCSCPGIVHMAPLRGRTM
jgi:hypothetical protein